MIRIADYVGRRRAVWIVVGLAVFALLSLFGIGEARADTHAEEGEAYTHCMAEADAAAAYFAGLNNPPAFHSPNCVYSENTDTGFWRAYLIRASNGVNTGINGLAGHSREYDHRFSLSASCQARESKQGHLYGVTGDYAFCDNGCVFQGSPPDRCYTIVVDGEESRICDSWDPTGATCRAGEGGFPAQPPGETPPDGDGDGTSDGNDPSPNNPGQGGGGGDGQPDEDGNCGGEGQPACGDPGSGSGNGNTSGGGGNCSTPPSSTGDPIAAQIAYQAWATRCAVEAMNNNGEGITIVGGGGGDGDGDGPGNPGSGIGEDFYEGDGRTVSDVYNSFKGRVSDAPIVSATASFFEPPQGGSCPIFTLPASPWWQAMTFDFHCKPPLSEVLYYMGFLVLALALLWAIRTAIE